jgi:hypothetical protein
MNEQDRTAAPQRDEISPPLLPDTRDAVRVRQGVVSGRVLLVLIASTCLGAVGLALAYWFT